LSSNKHSVLADDDEYDYYLMKVSKVPFQLERVENDDWGNTFPVGANVVRGYYYIRRKENPFKYELTRRRKNKDDKRVLCSFVNIKHVMHKKGRKKKQITFHINSFAL
jgi:hypothetical protein